MSKLQVPQKVRTGVRGVAEGGAAQASEATNAASAALEWTAGAVCAATAAPAARGRTAKIHSAQRVCMSAPFRSSRPGEIAVRRHPVGRRQRVKIFLIEQDSS